MTHFLQRYLAGEQERVWAELLTLGKQLRVEPLYTEAQAVVRETMRRAKHNIETLVSSLSSIDYVFGYGFLRPDEADFAQSAPPVYRPPDPNVQEQIEELESLTGTLPLALRGWYETIGAVNFVGDYPRWDPLVRLLDPLYVEPIEVVLDVCRTQRKWGTTGEAAQGNDGRHQFIFIAPDAHLKYNVSGMGAYEIAVPNEAIDGLLLHEPHNTTFINYLRICFRWAGFPGLENYPPPPEELTRLTQGLLSL